MTTHGVTNQPPLRAELNEFTVNVPLVEAVHAYDAGWAVENLTATGRLTGTAEFQQDARLANTCPPMLHTHDRYGHRIDEVAYHESYHRILAAAVGAGAHTSAWAEPRPGANVARAAQFMLFAQVEPGHACPVSMTHAAVASLQHSPGLAQAWLPRLLRRTYDQRLRVDKSSALMGMGMTEKQGGSDVRAGTTQATPTGDGTWRLRGHKWFCSAPMSDAFLMLARAPEGLSCFLVPRLLPDGERNSLLLQRLKDKLGNRANASAEVELQDAAALPVGEPGRGVRAIIDMVVRTRLDNILGATAGMRQSVAEALWHTRHRVAFGKPLVEQPAMVAVLADLALEAEAATALSMRLARAYDADASAHDKALRRLATAVGKYWVTKRGPGHAYEAMECLGGNGYIEDFPLARRYREQPVMAIWEGSGNVMALDVLRSITREPETMDAFEDEIARVSGVHRLLDEHMAATRTLLAHMTGKGSDDGAVAQMQARRLTESLALALQAALLIRTVPNAVADSFVQARLGSERGSMYGVLAPGADMNSILQRH